MKPVAFVKRGAQVNLQALADAGYQVVMVSVQDDVRLSSSLTDEARSSLSSYLLSHESDIAHGINGFDEIKGAFKELLGWPPRTSRREAE